MAEFKTIKQPSGTVSDIWIPMPYRIISKKVENDDLITFKLEPNDDSAIDPIRPGQFNMLYVFGVGEIPISVSSVIDTHPYLEHTIHNVGPVSGALTKLVVGDLVGVRGPFGTPWPIQKAKGKDVVLISGGVGLCPIRPVIEQLIENRESFGKVNVLFGTRSPDNLLYHQDIISWQSNASINFQVTVDHASSNWRGNVGVVTQLMDHAEFDPDKTVVFLCGPEIMMRFAIYACINEGIREENIYLSMERNMKCAVGFCGHCQLGPYFVCKDGAVFPYPSMKPYLNISEL